MDQQAGWPEFLSGLKNAEFEAWRDVYARLGGMIYRLARGMVGMADAEDVVQESLLQAFRKRRQFRGQTAKEFETWLYRIALNKCKDWLRKRQCRPVFAAVPDLSSRLIGGDGASFQEQLHDIDLLQAALQGVTPKLRALLLLQLEGCSYLEIGKVMKIKSKGTVCTRLGQAREQLKESLARLGWSAA